MAEIKDRDVYIVSAVRTPTGKFLGSLSGFSATDLGGKVVAAALERSGAPGDQVDEVFMGNVLQAGVGQAPARQAAIKGGIPEDVPAMTVNMVCGSGLRSVMLAASEIRAGESDLVVAGGMESMSNAPFLLPQARTGLRLGNGQVVDEMVHDGLWCAFENWHMGSAAEHIAREFKITREMQDEYAVKSQAKAVAAIEAGKFKNEIVPIEIPQRKGDPVVFDTDESPRKGTDLAGLAKLRPAFEKDGTVTAGNAPSVNDGASATVVASGKKVKELGLTPLARITGYATGATSPKMIFYAPVYAVRNLMEKTGTKIGDYDFIEANEAFAAQSLVDGNELGWDWDRCNVNGGAIALGHPIGSSGSRVLTTLLYALEDRKKTHGLATLCLGGGNAVALSVERV